MNNYLTEEQLIKKTKERIGKEKFESLELLAKYKMDSKKLYHEIDLAIAMCEKDDTPYNHDYLWKLLAAAQVYNDMIQRLAANPQLISYIDKQLGELK